MLFELVRVRSHSDNNLPDVALIQLVLCDVPQKKTTNKIGIGIHRSQSKHSRLPPTWRIGPSVICSGCKKANITAALDASDLYCRKILSLCFESHIFLQIMFRNLIPTHVFVVQRSIQHEHFRLSFN
jgi:hypothetical protein